MNLSRSSGVQLHPTSLPSGRLGPEAYAWIDWLASAGQTWWQMLPLGPPDEHDSPYKSASAFAASPRLLGDPSAPVSAAERLDFRERAAGWIEDWLAFAGSEALDDQVRFDREWAALRTYAAERGVKLIGDVPIYVAEGSADQLAHPEIFKAGAVAGVPPDAFTDKGQLWGNPLYDWPELRRQGYAWWIERFRRVFELFDLARIDHFRGFVAYWAVPADAEFALEGAWKRGPGRAPFDAARAALGELPLIAEDLGVITPPVTRLRESLGLPGMSVLQFGFTPGEEHTVHVPENNAVDQVVYTGTHDSDTIRGWYSSITDGSARVSPRRSAAVRDRRRRAALGADPARVRVAGGDRDDPGAGCAGARVRGADEPAGERGGLGVAARFFAFGRCRSARLRSVTEAAGRLPAGA